jgi:HK97 family phage major capsid protein
MTQQIIDTLDAIERKVSNSVGRLEQNQQEFAQRLVAIEQKNSRHVDTPAGPVSATSSGKSPKAWINAETGVQLKVYEPGEKMSRDVAHDPAGAELVREGFGIGHFARALARGAKTDIEKKAMSISVATAGGHLVPTPLAAGFIDRARAASTVVEAGASTIDLQSSSLKIARVTSDPTLQWLAENAASTPSDPAFGSVTLTAKTLRALVVASREVVDDAPNFPVLFSQMMDEAFAAEIDRVCLVGSGSGAEPLGLFGTAGIGTVSLGTNGATIANYDSFVDAITTLQASNIPRPTAFIYAPRTNGQLGKLKASDNQPLVAPRIVSEVPHLITSAIPVNQTQGTSTDCSAVLAGAWNNCIIGLRQQVVLEMFTQPNAANYQYTFLIHCRMDVQYARPSDFVRIVGLRA